MRVDTLLVTKGLCSTRQEAQEAVAMGSVLVNGQLVTKQSKDVSENSVISVSWARKYVSRGGEKLEGIFFDTFLTKERINQFLIGKVALDVGSSTGGFTDFLLQNSISEVTCVDVGSFQLHEKIISDKRVHVFENTDIRNFKSDKKYEVVVGDISFISLEKVLSTIMSFGAADTFFFLLIKPQFEVGKGNTKKGIVKSSDLVEKILCKYRKIANDNLCNDVTILPCRVSGSDGNQEYFLTFRTSVTVDTPK